MTHLLHHLIFSSADRRPDSRAVTFAGESKTYGELSEGVRSVCHGLLALGIRRSQRIAVYLEKRPEAVAAFFGASAAGAVFVPINPILKAEQVRHILRDCNVRALVTSVDRFNAIRTVLPECSDLQHVILVDDTAELPGIPDVSLHRWSELLGAPPKQGYRILDIDMAAILYTSGSTGLPKGVVLSHRNMVVGAKSVAQYLKNGPADSLLAALPLSFDAGFSQLTTAFHAGARVVLLNYLMPRDVLKALTQEEITGLTAVPPLWIQLSQLEWPPSVAQTLRYIANTGGRMPLETLRKLRNTLPRTKLYLMYGLTEAFRATYLPPELVDERPDSIGKAIPNAEILVLREDGTPCGPNEPGELVQRGALVSLGYWNDPERTAERFKPLPVQASSREKGLVLPEVAVFSGDIVQMDEEGYLYFVGRRDEMMKTSGYRVSPTEVEEILYSTKMVGECVAFGVPDEVLGQKICVIVTPPANGQLDITALLAECRSRMPAYMVPAQVEVRHGPLPRNANGKIDRKALCAEWSIKAVAAAG